MRCLIIVALVGVFALNQIRPAQAIGCISGGIAGARPVISPITASWAPLLAVSGGMN